MSCSTSCSDEDENGGFRRHESYQPTPQTRKIEKVFSNFHKGQLYLEAEVLPRCVILMRAATKLFF
jgi:hypothetical protein